MAIDSMPVPCGLLPLTLHSRHVLEYSRLLAIIRTPLESEILDSLNGGKITHLSSSFLLAHRMLYTLYSMTSSLQMTSMVLNEMNILNIELTKVEKLIELINHVLTLFRQLATRTGEMGTYACETHHALSRQHPKCVKVCLKTHSVVNKIQKESEIISGDLVSFNAWLYMAAQREQSAKVGYAILKIANLFLLPVKAIIEPPFVDKWLNDARTDYNRAAQVTDDIMHQRLVVVHCHTRVTHRLSAAVASNQHAERGLQICEEAAEYVLRTAHRWCQIHNALKQMCNLWTRLMMCCQMLRLRRFRNSERSELDAELLHTINVLLKMILFDHVEARSDWLKFMNF